jgi:hypothetical protein
MWDGYSDEYQATHGDELAASGGLAWGTTQIPEADLQVLGESPVTTSSSSAAAPPSGRSLSRSSAPDRSASISPSAARLTPPLMAEAGVDFPLDPRQRGSRSRCPTPASTSSSATTVR